MRIGELAERSDVPAKTIRYYESVGVLPEPRRLENGYRNYEVPTVARLEFIRSAQAIGLSLGEIRGVLDFRDSGQIPCVHVAELIDHRAREVSEKIAALERVRTDLQRLSRRARQLSPRDCEKANVCHIIEG
jgi:MerR family copper efflux transcriptional regulator